MRIIKPTLIAELYNNIFLYYAYEIGEFDAVEESLNLYGTRGEHLKPWG